LFYDATIKPNPASINAPYFNAEMAIAKAYQQDYAGAARYLNESRSQFNMPEDKIPYLSYFIAAGMLSEHNGKFDKAAQYYAEALKRGNTQSQHMIPPEMYYAHALVKTNRLNEAANVLSKFEHVKDARRYSAIGLNYYKSYAELLRARGDYAGYSGALQVYYAVKDSLTNLSRYRAIKEIEAKVRIRDKEQQIAILNNENAARLAQLRRERIFYTVLIGFATVIILLLVLYMRNRQIRNRMEVMQEVMDAEANERRKIADQLHDEINAMLALASLNISSTLEKEQDPNNEKKLSKAHDILSSVANTIRGISHRLTPFVIEKYGFKKAVEDLAEAINLSEKIQLETVIIGFDDTVQYPAHFLNDVYRIIQELVHNMIKHSGATHALLELVEHEGHISLMVEDNGVGMKDAPAKGHGLKAIRSRVAYLKGKIEIEGRKENGTLAVVELPV
ncbi:MAG TPA: ATP-binding protein, partial [Chitinophagaceae bacterium]|nr:ATP-binding protein [Chitinophagaceae bacterium]